MVVYQRAIPGTTVAPPGRLEVVVVTVTVILHTVMVLEILEAVVVMPKMVETVAAMIYRLGAVVVMEF